MTVSDDDTEMGGNRDKDGSDGFDWGKTEVSHGKSLPETRSELDEHRRSSSPVRVGRYLIKRLLGRGGFGAVYLAHDEQLDRRVAIKIAHRNLVSSIADASIYLEEARHVAKLDHPHIVPVHDVGSTDEVPFFSVSKFIDGENLAATLHEDRLNHVAAVRIAINIADALQHAHKHGLVHRDVKPGNILLDRAGTPYLVDFGLALSEDSVESESRYVGTPAYTSPEQARGEGHRVDGRSDVFSLGVVLYEMLTGRRPFRAENREMILQRVASFEPRPPRQYDESIPRDLDRICQKAMAKLASDRFGSAFDFAEDLRHHLESYEQATRAVDASGTAQFRGARSEVSKSQGGSVTHGVSQDTVPEAVGPVTSSTPTGGNREEHGHSSSHELSVVPKGIRSFDAHDADFYLQLIPGARDRHGLPESIRFWKTRLEERRPDQTFSIGLLYGPSGCGKSSLVHAGLVPRLDHHVHAVTVEAGGQNLEEQLCSAVRTQCPTLPRDRSLVDMVKMIRNGFGPAEGEKVLIVIDQFEQWLHANRDDMGGPLVQALRQCDGARVQAMLLVRDDFWMAATAFMREVEVRIAEGQNAAAVQLFPTRHAVNVLAAYGRAFGAIPSDSEKVSAEHRAFLHKAAEDLSQEGEIVCVRLALFAEMMKARPWTLASLAEVGGAQGVGVKFLESVFEGPAAPLSYRYHEQPARMTLRALLPPEGQSIRGHTRTKKELSLASGYGEDSKDFLELMSILDNEVRLITPSDTVAKTPSTESSSNPVPKVEQEYQLTHDYLVRSLRSWLTQKQRESPEGRAELLLAERSSLWAAKSENRHLPTLGESFRIRWRTDSTRWTDQERRMMARARKIHGIRLLGVGVCLAAIATLGMFFQQRLQDQRMTWKAESLVNGLASTDMDEFDVVLSELEPLRPWASPILVERLSEPTLDDGQRLRYSIAAMGDDPDSEDHLIGQLPRLPIDEFSVVRNALVGSDKAIPALQRVAKDPGIPSLERFQAACALVSMHPDDPSFHELEPLIMNGLVEDDSVVPEFELTERIEQLQQWRAAMLPGLWERIKDSDSGLSVRQRAATALAVYLSDQPDQMLDAMLRCRRRSEFAPFLIHLEQQLPSLQESLEGIVTEATGGLASQGPDSQRPVGQDYEQEHHRVAIAAAILAKFGQLQPMISLFEKPSSGSTWDPSLWTLTKFYSAELLIERDAIVQKLIAKEWHPSLMSEFIEVLGRCEKRGLVATEIGKVQSVLEKIYAEHPHAGVHQMSQWALKQFGQEPEISASKYVAISSPSSEKIERLSPGYLAVERALQDARERFEMEQEQWREKVSQKAPPADLLQDDSLQVGILFRGNGQTNLKFDPEHEEMVQQRLQELPVVGGPFASSAEFNKDEPIELGDIFSAERDRAFSYGCWIYCREQRTWGGVLSRFDTADGEMENHRGFDLWVDGDRFAVHLVNSEPNNSIKATTKAAVKLNHWNHVFVTYDGSSQASGVQIYLDGRPAEMDPLVNTLTDTIATDAPLMIGSRYGGYPLSGWIDDVRLYDRELEEADVRSIYEAGIGVVLRRLASERSPEQRGVLERAFVSSQIETIRGLEDQLQRMQYGVLHDHWDDRRRWFVDGQGHEFVVLPSVDARTGEDRVPYDFAIGVHPVTVAQFNQSDVVKYFDPETIESQKSPAELVSWFQVAEYCNWMSEQEGIPEDQWCFEPNEDGAYSWGMKVRPNHQQLRGYRLPTTEEWKYAGRCHANTRYFFGQPSALVDQYCWYSGNTRGVTRDVKTLPPNGFGLSDVHGSVWEYTHDLGELRRDGAVLRDSLAFLRGGAMNSGTSYISFRGITDGVSPDYRSHTYGFRLAKTLPVQE